MKKIFDNSYIEIKLPLNNTAVEALENSEYSYILNDLRSAKENEAVKSAWCDMTVAFEIANGKTHFMINTNICYGDDEPLDEEGTWVDFDPITAEYIKAEALKSFTRNIGEMQECRAEVPAVVA